jgi:hypothetical protein
MHIPKDVFGKRCKNGEGVAISSSVAFEPEERASTGSSIVMIVVCGARIWVVEAAVADKLI